PDYLIRQRRGIAQQQNGSGRNGNGQGMLVTRASKDRAQKRTHVLPVFNDAPPRSERRQVRLNLKVPKVDRCTCRRCYDPKGQPASPSSPRLDYENKRKRQAPDQQTIWESKAAATPQNHADPESARDPTPAGGDTYAPYDAEARHERGKTRRQ